jgi:hypothetical protein
MRFHSFVRMTFLTFFFCHTFQTAIHRVIPQDGPNLLSRDSMAYEPNFANFNNLNSFDVPPHFGEDDITDLTAEQQLPPAQPMDLIESNAH